MVELMGRFRGGRIEWCPVHSVSHPSRASSSRCKCSCRLNLRSRLFAVGFIAAQLQKPPEMPTKGSVRGLYSRKRKSSL